MSRKLSVSVVPVDFDDADDPEGQVHAVARRVFLGATNADVFARAERWLS